MKMLYLTDFNSWFQFCLRLAVLLFEICEITLSSNNTPLKKKEGKKSWLSIFAIRHLTLKALSVP